MDGFEIAAASVPGTDHTKPGKPVWKNNQDAYDFYQSDKYLIAVVCDGCGGVPNSKTEVGAHIGVRLVIRALSDLLEGGWGFTEDPASLLARLADQVADDLERIVRMQSADQHTRYALAAQQFLFTIVGVVMTEETTLVFSFGDGVYAVNGEIAVIPPFPNNAPPYLTYRFIPSSIDAALLKFEVRALLPTAEVQSLLIGSDGVAELIELADQPLPMLGTPVGPLSQFWEDPKFTANPDAIRRRLALVNREYVEDGLIKCGHLYDDTTLLVVRRT